jgi:hypothetical protein
MKKVIDDIIVLVILYDRTRNREGESLCVHFLEFLFWLLFFLQLDFIQILIIKIIKY